MMRAKLLAGIVVLVLLIGLAAQCQPTPAAPAGAPAEEVRVAMVISGSLGDKSFFDSGNEGLQRAAKELGAKVQVLECRDDPANFTPQITAAAENNDVVFLIAGYDFYDQIEEICPKFPDVHFLSVDEIYAGDKEIPNLSSIDYKENEGAYLVGVLSALMTNRTDIEGINEDKVVGIVGGMDIPVIRNFIVGFEQGAKSVDPDVKAEVLFIDTWNDSAKGKEAALTLIDKGADIVWQLTGRAGAGVFEAAKERDVYAIGADSVQEVEVPGTILTSQLKGVGISLYDVIKRAKEGTYKDGEIYSYGVADGGVGVSYSEYTEELVPADILEKVRQAEEDIKSGKVVVEEYK
jgi:basic membrane protein A